MRRRILSILLSASMLMPSFLPVSAYADEAAVVDDGIYTYEGFETEISIADDGESPEELFAMYVQQQFYMGVHGETYAAIPSEKFTGKDAVAYRIAREQIKAIAAGEQESTIVRIPVNELLGDKLVYTLDELGLSSFQDSDFREKAFAVFKVDFGSIARVLKLEYPYEMYWFGNNTGYTYPTISYGYDYETGKDSVFYPADGYTEICFKVSEDFKGSDDYETDVKKTAAAKLAVNNAKAIVAQATDMSDLEKLEFYRDSICELVSYNNDAAKASYSGGYGNPWQLIWVFDDDPDTKVVCEGYAKAFKYLCDLTQFDGDIYTYLVTGNMAVGKPGNGPHMWNIIHMEDDKNYLVDVTNVDEGTIGYRGYTLFMAPYAHGGLSNGYYAFKTAGSDIYYIYDDEIKGFYNEEELTLSGKEYIPPHVPIWGAGVETLAPTCSAVGTMQYTCTICGETKNEDIDKLPHTEAVDKAVAPSCTETGLSDGKHCSVCGEIIVAQEIVGALGHKEVIDKGTEATCTTSGISDGKHCSVCGEILVRQEIIPAHGHKEEIDEAKEPTCTEVGVTEGKYCSVCGEILVYQMIIPKLGHEEVIDKASEATCTEDGLTEGKHCSVCGEILLAQEMVEALGHTEEIIPGVEPTYTSVGYTEGKRCSVCEEILITPEEIPMLKKTGWSNENGEWYYYNADGELVTSKWLKDGNSWYYLGASGAMATGWLKDAGQWYYLDGSGAMVTGWKTIDNNKFYFESSGVMATGWKKLDGKWYFFKPDGAMAVGFGKADGYWYYFDENGQMLTGWIKDNGQWYYFGAGGEMKNGLTKIGKEKYYFDVTGAMKTGWIKLGGKWYLFKGDGTMAVNGFGKADGYWYYFDADGAMLTGWIKDGSDWYYFGAGGEMKTGWLTLNGVTYYLKTTGAMACSETLKIGGVSYTFSASGALRK